MSAVSLLNPKAEFARASQALAINITAAKGIQEVVKSNLGPKGTMKMLVSGAGDIKITKDGNVLLHEMQIQHPTASLIARASTAMDNITGDGTTSTVLLIGELLKQADVYISEGLHPRLVANGFTVASKKCFEVLDAMKIPIEVEKEALLGIAGTALATKIQHNVAKILAEICVDAVLAVRVPEKMIDLHMVEIMTMPHKTDTDTSLVRGLVLDHGGRHPNMPKKVTNAYILTCNVSMEYEKTEINSGFFYKTAEEREKLVASEREFITQRVQKVIDLKKKICDGTDKNFVVINQKGIDPVSLDMLAREGILGLRRAKRRNMERLALACGGSAMNSFDDLSEDCLGYAGLVYEHVLGEEKYTFVEQCKNPKSVTILIKGPNKFVINQLKDATTDGLRAVFNSIEDKCLVPGAGALEVACYSELMKLKDTIKGKTRLGVQAFAEALLVIPKTLAANSGFDVQDTLVKLQADHFSSEGSPVGLDVSSGEPVNPTSMAVYDNYCVKKQIINSCSVIASNLLLVDEIMRAGLSSLKS